MATKTLKVNPKPSIVEISFSIDGCTLNLDGNPPHVILKLLAEAKSSRLVCFHDGCLGDIKVSHLAKRVLYKMKKLIINYQTALDDDESYYISGTGGLNALELVAKLLLDESTTPPDLGKVIIEFDYDNAELANAVVEYTVTKDDDLLELNDQIVGTLHKHYLEIGELQNDTAMTSAAIYLASCDAGQVMFNILKQLVHRRDKVETPIVTGGTVTTRVFDKDGE